MSAYLPHRPRLRTLLALADLGGMLFAIWLAYAIRFNAVERAGRWQELLANPGLLAWALFSGWALAVAAELYEPEALHRRREVIVRVLVMVAAWSVAIVLASYVRPHWAYGRGLLALTATSWAVLLIAARWAMTAYQRRRRWRFPALVVGVPEVVATFCRELNRRPSAPWQPLNAADLPLETIADEIKRRGASIVILAGSDEHDAELGPALNQLHFSGVPVVAASEVWAWLEERLPVEALTPSLFLHQPGFGAVHWTFFNRLTRIADVVLALLLLILSAPLLFLAALLVVLTDGWPVLYRQKRVGQYGRRFTMYKLRTMARDAETNGPAFAAESDPRISPIGAVLRRFRLDELPQLLNVLRGEMSLVGPRPERPAFVAQLSADLPYYSFRLAVPPGITGWAQVNTAYARTLEDHRLKLEFDLYFIRERSLRLYMLTLLRTVSAALVGVRSAEQRATSPAAAPTFSTASKEPVSRVRS